MYFVINSVFCTKHIFACASKRCRGRHDAPCVFVQPFCFCCSHVPSGVCLPVGRYLWSTGLRPHRTVLISLFLREIVLPRMCVFLLRLLGEPCLSDPSAHVVLVPGAAHWRELICSVQGQPPPRPAGPLLLGSRACGARRCSTATVLPPLCPTRDVCPHL